MDFVYVLIGVLVYVKVAFLSDFRLIIEAISVAILGAIQEAI